jgi:hypothetical protein
MSLNPQAQGNDLYDVLEGSVSSYFSQIDSVIMQDECVNGQYRTTASGSYANACPAAMPAFTRVCLSTNGSTIVDMDTSYITVKLTFTLSMNQAITAGANNCSKIFVGFKNSLEALERYSIYVNAQELYTQLVVQRFTPELFDGKIIRRHQKVRCKPLNNNGGSRRQPHMTFLKEERMRGEFGRGCDAWRGSLESSMEHAGRVSGVRRLWMAVHAGK